MTPTTTSPTILLLKSPSTPEDKYAALFSNQGFNPVFLPVLDHTFHSHNLSLVRSILTAGELTPGPQRKYGGLIFTSQRAVEGFGRVLRDIHDTKDSIPLPLPNEKNNTPGYLPLYTVGPATSAALSTLRDQFLSGHGYNAEILGADSGNGEVLARFILGHYNSLPYSHTHTHTHHTHTHTDHPDGNAEAEGDMEGKRDGKKFPLLFLTGEQHRDIIPKTLMGMDMGMGELPPSERIPLRELVVYEAGIKPGLVGELERTLRHLLPGSRSGSGEGEGRVLWIVLFSPGSSDAVLSSLRGVGLDGAERKKVFIATIGSTTRDHLKNNFGIEADVCAERPSPEGLYAGIQGVMDRLNM